MVAEILSQDEINALLEQTGGLDSAGSASTGGLESGGQTEISEKPEPAKAESPAPRKTVAAQPAVAAAQPPTDLQGKVNSYRDLQIRFSVEVGRTILKLKEVLKLGNNSIVELQKLKEEPVDVLINGQKIAEGEVVIIDDNFGVKIIRFLNDNEVVEFLNKYKRQ